MRAGTAGNSGYRWDTRGARTSFNTGMTFRAIFNTHDNSTDRKARFGFSNTSFLYTPVNGMWWELDALALRGYIKRSGDGTHQTSRTTLSDSTTYMVEIYADSDTQFTFTLYAAPTGTTLALSS